MPNFKPSYIRVSEYATASLSQARDGVQINISFVNGYGASIECHSDSYGGKCDLWTLTVTYDGRPRYDTPITPDVIGHLEADEVETLLKRIEELPPKFVTEGE